MWSVLLQNLTAPDDFSFGSVNPASQTVNAGGTANYVISINPLGNAGSPVAFSCSDLPVGATCTFTPNPATPVAGGSSVALAIAVPASASVPFKLTAPRLTAAPYRIPIVFSAFALISLLLVPTRLFRRHGFAVAFTCLAVVATLVSMSACSGGGSGGGGGGGQGQPFQIEIKGSSGNFQHSTTVQLIVN